jgi:geranylgeranyl diphosphate synthase type I
LGKPVCSDLREGKQTLLIVKALEMGSTHDRKLINRLLGNKNVTAGEIESFREVVKKTGSLAYSQSLARDLVEKGKKALEKCIIQKDAKDFMIGIADYIVNREV